MHIAKLNGHGMQAKYSNQQKEEKGNQLTMLWMCWSVTQPLAPKVIIITIITSIIKHMSVVSVGVPLNKG